MSGDDRWESNQRDLRSPRGTVGRPCRNKCRNKVPLGKRDLLPTKMGGVLNLLFSRGICHSPEEKPTASDVHLQP